VAAHLRCGIVLHAVLGEARRDKGHVEKEPRGRSILSTPATNHHHRSPCLGRFCPCISPGLRRLAAGIFAK